MYTITQRLIQSAPFVQQMLRREPCIMLDLRNADVRTTLSIMFCLMMEGVDTAPAIHGWLSERGSKFERETIDFFLDQYDGNDPEHHLWERHNFGDYFPMYELLDDHQPVNSKFD
jgi:hypothetical protein